MATTYSFIASATPTSGTSVTFSSIPSTYDDLVLKVCLRTTSTSATNLSFVYYTLNSNSNAIYSTVKNYLTTGSGLQVAWGYNSGSGVGESYVPTALDINADYFSNSELYFSKYKASQNKQVFLQSVIGENSTDYFLETSSSSFSDTTAISSISATLTTGSFASGSSLYLYGIKTS